MIHNKNMQHMSFQNLMEKEWLQTNGCGGYASSTVLHCHTRKYHGLLVANIDNPGGRFVLLSKLEDYVRVRDKDFYLSIHKYPMVYYPNEKHYLSQFTLDLYPRFTYTIDKDIIVEKEVMLEQKENTLLMRYHIREATSPVILIVKPFLAYRDIHSLSQKNESIESETNRILNGFSTVPYDGMPPIYFQANRKAHFFPSPQWYRQFEYLKERDRGFSYQEDLFMPGIFECTMQSGEEIIFRVSVRPDRRKIKNIWKKEEGRRKRQREEDKKNLRSKDGALLQLMSAASDFIIRNRRNKLSIIAGYHWFYEWGRDALISLPGLTFCLNRIDEGIEILKNISELRRDGLVPNNISERDERSAYNSADASLWYFWCIQELLRVTDDPDLIMRDFWPVMIDIIKHLNENTSRQISVLEDGLLNVGDPTTQLTWMDAQVHGVPVTPRYGCPVEINALWYNALCLIRQLATDYGKNVPFDVENRLEKIGKSFELNFWIQNKQYLADTWMPQSNSRDESVRPNQIFAISLPFNVVKDHDKAVGIMKKVSQELLTPYGLRTLSPDDPRYHGRYEGSPEERDAAYHQGTVWPWLIGHYGEALLKTEHSKESAIQTLSKIVTTMEKHLSDKGIGHISEIFSGDPPHEACGCIAQAWSLGELIRLKTLIEG